MKKIIIPILILAAVIAGAVHWQRNDVPATDQQLILYGNIDVRVVNLSFETSGRVLDIAVEEGDRVVAGQRLATLDATRLELSRDAAQAQVKALQAQLDELLAGSRPEQIEQYRAQLEAAKIEAVNAEHNAVRLHDLVQRNLASERDAEDARAAANAARARTEAARATLRLAEAGSRKESIAAAQAALENAHARLALAQRDLDDAVLLAPRAGIVQNRILEPGDIASPQSPVLTLVIDDPQWARVYVAEPGLGQIKPGLPASISSESFPDRTYPGRVASISASAEFTPKSVETPEIRTDLVYQVRVYLCAPSDELRQGMPVTVSIQTIEHDSRQDACREQADKQ